MPEITGATVNSWIACRSSLSGITIARCPAPPHVHSTGGITTVRALRPERGLLVRYDLADVFTDAPLGGNQLAVFTELTAVDPVVMQAIALEMNLSETVFLCPAEAGGDVKPKLYSTVCEVDFAGHPLLGTAAVYAQAVADQDDIQSIDVGGGVCLIGSGRLRFPGPGGCAAGPADRTATT